MHHVTLQQAKVKLFEYSQLYLLEVFLLYSLYSSDMIKEHLICFFGSIIISFFFLFLDTNWLERICFASLKSPSMFLFFNHSAPTLMIALEVESCNTPRITHICAIYASQWLTDGRMDSTRWRTGKEETIARASGRQSEEKNGSSWRHLRRDELCRGVSGRAGEGPQWRN